MNQLVLFQVSIEADGDRVECPKSWDWKAMMSVSLMEAMSYGIPVIATNSGGTNELVNGESGILVKQNDSSLNSIRTLKKENEKQKRLNKKYKNKYRKYKSKSKSKSKSSSSDKGCVGLFCKYPSRKGRKKTKKRKKK